MVAQDPEQSAVVGASKPRLFAMLGPGLISGASDDDPSGIATYSQAGAMFGFGLLWTMVLTYPLMISVQEISARIGRTALTATMSSQEMWLLTTSAPRPAGDLRRSAPP